MAVGWERCGWGWGVGGVGGVWGGSGDFLFNKIWKMNHHAF